MWQQARARTRNTDARLFIVLDCPSAGSLSLSLSLSLKPFSFSFSLSRALSLSLSRSLSRSLARSLSRSLSLSLALSPPPSLPLPPSLSLIVSLSISFRFVGAESASSACCCCLRHRFVCVWCVYSGKGEGGRGKWCVWEVVCVGSDVYASAQRSARAHSPHAPLHA